MIKRLLLLIIAVAIGGVVMKISENIELDIWLARVIGGTICVIVYILMRKFLIKE